MDKYIFFDLETTDLDVSKAKIVQICYIKGIIQNEKFIEEKVINRIVKPENYKIPLKTTEIHGITNEEAIKNGILFEDIVKELLEDLKDIKYIVGHNIIDYDIPVLLNNLSSINITIDLDKYIAEDTIKMCGKYTNGKKVKLQDLYTYFNNKKFDNAHNALNDVYATINCYENLKKNKDMTKLMETINNNVGEKIILFGKYKGIRYRDILNVKWYCDWIVEADIKTKDSKILRKYIMENKKIVFNKFYDMIKVTKKINFKDILEIISYDIEFNKIFNRSKILIEYVEFTKPYIISNIDKNIYNPYLNIFILYCLHKGKTKHINNIYENINIDSFDKIHLIKKNSLKSSYDRYKESRALAKDFMNIAIIKKLYDREYKYKDMIDIIPEVYEMNKPYLLELVSSLLYDAKQEDIDYINIDEEYNNISIIGDVYILLNNGIINIVEKYEYKQFIEMLINYGMSKKKITYLQIYECTTNKVYTMTKVDKIIKENIINIIKDIIIK